MTLTVALGDLTAAGTTNVELGAAWKKTSKEGRPYTSVKLDDPSFPAPVYASLVEADLSADPIEQFQKHDPSDEAFDRSNVGPTPSNRLI